jgi:hypothetical protein
MLLQEQEEREPEAALGKTACAAMACRTTIRKQPRGRFALIEILSMCRGTDEDNNGSEDERTAPQFWLRHELQ